MRLIKYLVRNFRSVEDSGWIEIDDPTAFVGVNESGKTNLLLPLWKLNPAKEGELEPTSDYPKNNYQEIRDRPSGTVFVQAIFDIGDLTERFATLTGYDREQLRRVHVWKTFDDEFHWSFLDAIPPKTIQALGLAATLDGLLSGINAASELASESGLKARCETKIAELRPKEGATVAVELFDKIYAGIKALFVADHAKSSAIHPQIAQAIETLSKTHSIFHRAPPTKTEGLWEEFISGMPVFLYYTLTH